VSDGAWLLLHQREEVVGQRDRLDDVGAYDLSRKISKKIERELMYSGSIRVTATIRRSRCSALAR